MHDRTTAGRSARQQLTARRSAAILLLAKDLESPKAAREFARAFIAYHDPGASEDYVEAVVLVVCELVTNSVRYGTEPGDSLRVTLSVDDTRTRVEVRDPVRRRPRLRPASVQRDRGRGPDHPRRAVPRLVGSGRRPVRQDRVGRGEGVMTGPHPTAPSTVPV
ncbi:ATP-binding protein [Streptomyces sp. NEAU-S77]|uniref:ATP-binding protein n=1 Tax=Streptomyces sp. NEAU-S77 TaxID=3411033 RepID=UPI003BA1AB66